VVIGSFAHAVARAQAAPWSAAVLRHLGHEGGSAVFVDVDGVMVGALRLADPIRLDTPRALRLTFGSSHCTSSPIEDGTASWSPWAPHILEAWLDKTGF
jgi:hypothetical protein